MYCLAKIVEKENNNSVLGHPLNIVDRSDDISKIFESVERRVKDGCPASLMRIYKEVPFEVKVGARLKGE